MMKLEDVRNSNTLRVLFIGGLVLLLLIPMGMVQSLIRERSQMYQQAEAQVRASWGGGQLLAGPILTLPCIRSTENNTGWSYAARYRHLQSETMTITGHVETQVRYRGIYRTPVYTAELQVQGTFDLAQPGDDSKVKLEQGTIQIPLSGSRALKGPVRLLWDGEEITLTPHRGTAKGESIILSGRLPVRLLGRDQVHHFEYRLRVAGSGDLSFAPSAQQVVVRLESNWNAPGFFGGWLPSSHDITAAGFKAAWDINGLLPDLGHEDSEGISRQWFGDVDRFGVNFIQTVDTYQVVTRAAKYAVLFIGLTFIVYFLTELFGNAALHLVQYLLVGLANCIFYLLLLSLAEHIPFAAAYILSACASTALIALYSVSILGNRFKAALVFAVLCGLYAYLYTALLSEAYALLIGSIGLFAVLAAIMYLTRHIDWRLAGVQRHD